MIVVADSGPLHDLILLEHVDLLRRFYGQVLVPDLVAGELPTACAPDIVRKWMANPPTWVEVRPVATDAISRVADDLDLGERAAIALAETVAADLPLIDEASGRAEAKRRRLRVTGTLGVLRAGAEQGVVNVPDLIERLKSTTFYLDETFVKSVFAPWLESQPEADSRSAAAVTTTSNAYCGALGISPPRIDQGSCGIRWPFGDERTMREYLRSGAQTKLRRRLEADAKSLYALYQYGRLHGCVRLRWGFLDEMLPAPWVHRDESPLYHLLKEAHERRVALEVVVGSAPGWADPWARARRAFVATDAWHSPSLLADEQGYEIPRADVQLARLPDGPRRDNK